MTSAASPALPLTDYADMADLPFSGAHGGGWGDFFAPLAAAPAMRAWLFLSITPADIVPLFALARLISQRWEARFPAPCPDTQTAQAA